MNVLLLGHEGGWPDGWLLPVLLRAGLLTAEDAERIEGSDAPTAWEACRAAGIAGDDRIVAEVARGFGLPVADMKGVAASAAAYLPGDLAVRLRVVPLSLDRLLHIACDNPANLLIEDSVAFAVGRRVRIYLASPAAVDAALSRLYPAQFVSAMVDRLSDQKARAIA